MPEIILPNGWAPRRHQRKAWSYLERGGKRAIMIWHRRAGKDDLCLHRAAVAAFERPATYWHMLPEAAQARKAIWTAINPHTGIRRIDEAFPQAVRRRTHDQEMYIEFKNGSTWQVVGSDNFNSLVGSPPYGIIFSEWALANPAAWAYLRPILAENGGWAIFITTPRGRNHAAKMYEGALQDPDWFAELLDAEQTGVFDNVTLAAERAEYRREHGEAIGDAMFNQEYLCSFDAAILGAYYTRELADARREGRIGKVPHEPALPVHTAWDLGMTDNMAIWCYQLGAGQIRVIDFHQSSGHKLSVYADWLESRPYKLGTDWVPHDAKVPEMGTGLTRVETLIGLGRSPRLVPDHRVRDGINALRQTMPIMWFDAENCAEGLEALAQYHEGYDEKARVLTGHPKHDWSSHAADAARYMAVAYRAERPTAVKEPARVIGVGKGASTVTLNDLWRANKAKRGGGRI